MLFGRSEGLGVLAGAHAGCDEAGRGDDQHHDQRSDWSRELSQFTHAVAHVVDQVKEHPDPNRDDADDDEDHERDENRGAGTIQGWLLSHRGGVDVWRERVATLV